MQRRATLLLRPLALLAVMAAGLTSAGCVPTTSWLPDSSGVVYTAGKDFNQLAVYDFKKGEQRVLVADTGAPTLAPAVSPDGKRVAVAKLIVEPKQKQTRLQVVIYDLQGKEVRRSKVLDWLTLEEPREKESRKGEDAAAYPQLFWAPAAHGDRILICTAFYTGIYDVKADQLVRAGEAALLVFRGGPVRPDGAGFLVMKNFKGWSTMLFKRDKLADDLDPRFAFVGWDGKEQPIKAPALLVDKDAMARETDTNKLMALLMPNLFESGWDGDVARVSYNGDRLQYFVKKGAALLDRVPVEMTDAGLVLSRYRFPGGEAELRLIAPVEKDKDKAVLSLNTMRLEVLKKGKKAPEVVVKDGRPCVPVVSPNGEFVAVRYFTPDKGKDRRDRNALVIVNKKGETVAHLGLAH
jgi:hypothetical protein